MIKLGKSLEPTLLSKKTQNDPLNANREDLAHRVNWIAQKSRREQTNIQMQHKGMRQIVCENSSVRQLKGCLQKEINLVTLPKREVRQDRNYHLFQKNDFANSKNNSQKKSCQRRQKLSLISKRPSLRKISNFISFKPQIISPSIKHDEDKLWENVFPLQKQVDLDSKKQGKRCIRISSRRQCLAQISKN